MALLADLIQDINSLSTSINTNTLVGGARASVSSGIKSFMITPKEKAQILANFEMQFTGAIINKIIDATIQARVSEVEIALKNKELIVQEKELLLKQAQIDVMNREIAAKEALNTAQTALLTQQKLTEVQQTEKVTKESDLLTSNKALVDAQKLTQEKQRLDVMAGINIKNEQALSTRQSAKFEEARRVVLLESTRQNAQIQKSKEENATLNSLAIDDSFIVTESHLTRVKAALDAISVGTLTYAEELTSSVGQVSAGV